MQEYKTYHSEQYVDREPEKKLVLDAIAKKRPRVFIFEGDRGVGKTWLLFSLFLLLNEQSDLRPFIVSLFPYSSPELQGKENVWLNQERSFSIDDLNELLQKVTQYWEIKDTPDVSEEARKEYFARGLASAQEKPTPVLLIDSIYECDEKIRQALEEYLIIPLISSGKGFIILSGRGKAPGWQRPELRQEPVTLKEFKIAQCEELLRKINSKHLDKLGVIFKLSAGYPLLVWLLGSAKQEPEEYLDTAIDILLEDTLKNRIPSEEYQSIRDQLEKLALIPTVFRPIEVENYLFSDEEEQAKRANTSELINTLLGSHIMKYKSGGYSINQSISAPLKEYLKLPSSSGTRQNYQDLLAGIYDDLANKFPEAEDYYQGLKATIQSI